MSALSFRPAEPDDVERLVEIHTAAFPDPRGHDERRRNFLAKPFGPFADLHVATMREGGRDEIVGHAFGFGLSTWIGGRDVPVMGIATLGVAPEARGRGVASALVAHLHEVARAAGLVASFLYPFRQGFYARLGYVGAPPVVALPIALEALVPFVVRSSRVRRATGEDRHLLAGLYAAEARRATGMLVRTERLWTMHFSNERRSFFVLERDGRARGYVSFSLEQADVHGEIRLDVVDLVGETNDDRLALLGFLSMMRDQATEADLCLAADDPLLVPLVDRDGDRRRAGTSRVEHPLGLFATGPMLRLVDPRAALETRGYASDGLFRVLVDGDELGLVIADGRASVAGEARGPTLAFTLRGLTAVALGGVPVLKAASLGWVRGDRDALHAAARSIDVPGWHTWDRF